MYDMIRAEKKRTLVVYVENKPGVLNRVASLFRRRVYNIDSLNVGRTHEPGVSRMTIVLYADDDKARRIEANLLKLVNVIEVKDITHTPSVGRNLAMIRVDVGPGGRANVMQLCEVFRARVVDVANESMVVEITGTQDKIDGLVSVLRPLGISEMVQTGVIAMTRGVTSELGQTAGESTSGQQHLANGQSLYQGPSAL